MFSKYRKIKHADGSIGFIFKNPDDIFPLIASNWHKQFKSSIKALKEISADIDAVVSREIEGFLFELDKANSSIQLKLRGLYSVYIIQPCSQSNINWYRKAVLQILNEERDLRGLLFETFGKIFDNRKNIEIVMEIIKEQRDKLLTSQQDKEKAEVDEAFKKSKDDIDELIKK